MPEHDLNQIGTKSAYPHSMIFRVTSSLVLIWALLGFAPLHSLAQSVISPEVKRLTAKDLHPISLDQAGPEYAIAQGTFELSFIQPVEPGLSIRATAFRVSPALILTNKHVVANLLGRETLDPRTPEVMGELETRMRNITLRSPLKGFEVRINHLAYCSVDLDFCVLRISTLSKSSSVPHLKLAISNETLRPPHRPVIGVVGNMNGKGLLASADRLVGIQPNGLLFHCAPTSPLDSGGNSGSPLFNANGEVIGIDGYTFNLDSGCRFRDQTTGGGTSSEAILGDLKINAPALHSEIIAN